MHSRRSLHFSAQLQGQNAALWPSWLLVLLRLLPDAPSGLRTSSAASRAAHSSSASRRICLSCLLGQFVFFSLWADSASSVDLHLCCQLGVGRCCLPAFDLLQDVPFARDPAQLCHSRTRLGACSHTTLQAFYLHLECWAASFAGLQLFLKLGLRLVNASSVPMPSATLTGTDAASAPEASPKSRSSPQPSSRSKTSGSGASVFAANCFWSSAMRASFSFSLVAKLPWLQARDIFMISWRRCTAN